VRPREHAGGLLCIEELEAPKHGAAEGLRQPACVMNRPRVEPAVGPKPAAGDEEVQMRMPVGTRRVRLQTGDDAELALTS